ncbi:hypothetical protein PI125_g20263 [Phytophthora idaei]|nr:hypothetical protein PI125_g20263 [Phytophthora idaei]
MKDADLETMLMRDPAEFGDTEYVGIDIAALVSRELELKKSVGGRFGSDPNIPDPSEPV